MSEKAVNFRFGGNSEDLEKMLGRVESGFDHLEKVAKTVEGAFAFEKIKESFLEFIKESDDATLAQQKFAITLQSTGQAGSAAEMQELADSLEKVTTFSAEATMGAASMLARFKIGQEQIKQMIPAVQDLASFMGTDLVNASDSVGRAVAIGSQGLRALRLNMDAGARAAFDMAGKQERIQMIMDAVKGSMSGMAQVAGSTTSAAVIQLSAAMKHLQESVGSVLEKPVGAAIRGITNAVISAKAAFDGMSPTARGAMVALGGGVVIAAGLVAGLSALTGALGIIAPFFGPIVSGLAFIGGAELSLAGATMGLAGAFAALKAVAVPLWGAIIAPALAVGAGILGVILIVGAMRDVWISSGEDIKQGLAELSKWIQTQLGAAITWVGAQWRELAGDMIDVFGPVVKGVAHFFSAMIDGIVEKFMLIKGMLSGMSPEDAGAKAREAVNNSGSEATLANIKESLSEVGKTISSAGSTAMVYLETGADIAKEGLGYAGSALTQSFRSGTTAIKGVLDKMGLNFEAMGTKKEVADVKKGKGGGGGGDGDKAAGVTLKDLFVGATDKAMKAADASIAGAMEKAFGGGSKGMAAASSFLNKLETTSSLSEATLSTILTRTGTGLAEISGVSNALSGVSDSVVNSLLKASNYNMTAVTDVAPALRGMSDGTVNALLKASGGSMTALETIAPHVSSLSEAAITAFMGAGGSLSGLAQMGDDFASQSTVMATAVAAADTYWASFDGAMQQLGSKAAEAAGGIASSMGAAGGAFSNVMGALAKGDMMGAAVSGITSIITQSKSFQAISNIINQMFSNFAQALNPLFDGLAPILQLVGTLLSSIGGAIQAIMQGIQPLFAVIAAVLAPIFSIVNAVFGGLKDIFKAIFAPIMPIVKSLMPIFKIVSDVFAAIAPILIQLFVKTSPMMLILNLVTSLFTALEPVFKGLSESIGKFINFAMQIFKSLAGVWNNVVSFIANIAEKFINLIPGMGEQAKSFGNAIRGAAINIDSLDKAMAQITTDASTQSDVTFPKLENSIDGASGAAKEMGNAPQGFKVALDEFQAATALSVQGMKDFNSLTSGSLGSPDPSNVPTIVAGSLPSVSSSANGSTAPQAASNAVGATVNMYVTAADPAALAAAVQTRINQTNLAATGNPNGGSRYSTPATSSSYK